MWVARNSMFRLAQEMTRFRGCSIFVCPVCNRYWGKSEGKQQFYCKGTGHERHPGCFAEPVEVVPVGFALIGLETAPPERDS